MPKSALTLVRAVAAVLVLSGLLAGCSSRTALGCGDHRFDDSHSVAPLRIPDDLSVPDDSGALSVPPASSASAAGTKMNRDGCLVNPPQFSTQGAGAARS